MEGFDNDASDVIPAMHVLFACTKRTEGMQRIEDSLGKDRHNCIEFICLLVETH